jgi:AcrR family transcriptional regulator
MPSSSTSSRRRAPNQLPAGRHGLSRTFVTRNQRERMLAAVAEVVRRQGYADMTVEDIISEAGVSRRTFYDHFKSKDRVFLAAYDAAVDELKAASEEAFEGGTGLVERCEAVLRTVVDFFGEQPAYTSLCVVEVLAAGPAALERRAATMHWFAELLDRAATDVPKSRRPPAVVAESLIGGIYEILYARALRKQLDELPELLPDLLYSTVLPYVGPETAAEARKASRPRRRKRS